MVKPVRTLYRELRGVGQEARLTLDPRFPYVHWCMAELRARTREPDTGGPPQDVSQGVARLIANIKSVIRIDTRKLEHLIAAQIAGGHVMLADAHGVGKTSLAKALAGSIRWAQPQEDRGLKAFNRIQCTVDLLPQDILGYSRFLDSSSRIAFVRGPIFAHYVLCDEINLLTPKTQGSFFQAMEEQAVTVEGQTYPLPAPQLDRFMIELSMGYPEAADEAAIVRQHGREDAWASFGPVLTSAELEAWQAQVDRVELHPEIVNYIVSCVRPRRLPPDVAMGASPRTGVKLSRLARALALVPGLDLLSVDLVKESFPPAVAHRLGQNAPSARAAPGLQEILSTVPVEPSRRRAAP